MENLVEILENIWKENVRSLYISGLISTERGLQAEIYRQLKDYDNFNIWIEPTIFFTPSADLDYKKPDIIITMGREIVGIIELKYKPYGATYYIEDIEKLSSFSNIPKEYKLPLFTIPNSGEWSKENKDLFTVSSNFLSVFAVIAWNDAWSLYINKWGNQKVKIPKNFLHLTGSISEKEILFKANHLK